MISFLLTSSVPTYRILLTGDLTEAQRTIADLNNNETLNAGDICDIDVSRSQLTTVNTVLPISYLLKSRNIEMELSERGTVCSGKLNRPFNGKLNIF